MSDAFLQGLTRDLAALKRDGFYKRERLMTSRQSAQINVSGHWNSPRFWARLPLAHPFRAEAAWGRRENDGFVAVEKYPMMHVGVDRSCQHTCFDITTKRDII